MLLRFAAFRPAIVPRVPVVAAYVIRGLGVIELVSSEPLFQEGASLKTLVLNDTPAGWRVSVKYVPPIVRERHSKS